MTIGQQIEKEYHKQYDEPINVDFKNFGEIIDREFKEIKAELIKIFQDRGEKAFTENEYYHYRTAQEIVESQFKKRGL